MVGLPDQSGFAAWGARALASILILMGGHLCTAPRPQKEADALASAGHDVLVRGVWFDPELAERDQLLLNGVEWRFEPVLDFRRSASRLTNLRVRLRSRIARELYLRWGRFTPDLHGYGVTQMLAVAREARADLTIVHSESGLWVGNQLLDEGFNVGVDFEDWFSKDFLPEGRSARWVAELKGLESRLARDCKYCLTTSNALAEALSLAYCVRKPTVVYNVFPLADRDKLDHQKRDRQNLRLPSVHWFSQTIGPGRGLGVLLEALRHLKASAEIHLRGNYAGSSRKWLEALIPAEWRNRFFIHPTVPNGELMSRIAEHDIGLALESPVIPSRDLTITNKLFQYLQAGLAVIATDTAGQREIFSQWPGVGKLIPSNPLALANALEQLLGSSSDLAAAKAASIDASKRRLNWEREANCLLEAAENALR